MLHVVMFGSIACAGRLHRLCRQAVAWQVKLMGWVLLAFHRFTQAAIWWPSEAVSYSIATGFHSYIVILCAARFAAVLAISHLVFALPSGV